MKLCKTCDTEKEYIEFSKDNAKRDGHSTQCRSCKANYKKINAAAVSLKKKEWNAKNKERIEYTNSLNKENRLASAKKYRNKNKKLVAAKYKQWRDVNKDIADAATKTWRQANKQRIRDNEAFRRKHDLEYKIKKNLRIRLRHALKRNLKNSSAVRDLGCSLDEFKLYMTQKFVNGMTWDNYGTYWHIDHIKPLICFDLTDPEQCKAACHYSNLQPLTAFDNMSKGGKYEK